MRCKINHTASNKYPAYISIILSGVYNVFTTNEIKIQSSGTAAVFLVLQKPKMSCMKNKLLLGIITVVLKMHCFGQLRLPAVLSSNMVLQQNDSVLLWGWGNPAEKVFITTSWDNRTDSVLTGNGAKWSIKVKTPAAGGPYTITFKQREKIVLDNIMSGEVWFCSGQSNMDWNFYAGVNDMQAEIDLGTQPNLRFFYITKNTANYPQEDTRGQWAVCDSNNLKPFSAVAYFFAKRLQEELNVPVGLIQSSWGGTPAEVWTPAEKINSNSILKSSYEKLDSFMWWPKTPGAAYNAMVAPVINFSIAGAIWYQGEGNTASPSGYSSLLTTMIDAWRAAWKKNLPFYFVQIAPFTYGKGYAAAIIREQQAIASKHDNTGMVVISDLVEDSTNQHPKNKKDVGLRLANEALALTYHKDSIVVQYPVFDKVQFAGDKAVIGFLYMGGEILTAGTAVNALEIAGDDRIFYPAEAKIEKDILTVWSKMVKEPVAVRYSFSNAGIGNLFSKFGLPVVPFRTDDWPLQ